MAPQFTWKGLWDIAMREAGLTAPQGFNTAQNALAALSEAQHSLQQISNAVTSRSLAISVSPGLSATGTYDYPMDVKLPLTWQFTPDGGAEPLDVRQITFDEMDRQKRLGGAQSIVMIPVTSLDLSVSVEGSSLFLFPFQSLTGELTLKYVPHLLPFDPSNPTGDWTAFGANPLALMKTTGPAREFGTAIMGIKDFLVMKLLEDMPDALQRFPTRYKRAEANWERAKQFAVKDKPQMNARQLFRPHNGVLQ